MATILLDSSVILDHLNGRRDRTAYLEKLLDEGHLLGCCPVNITEVYAGLRPTEEAMTKLFIDDLEFFAVTPDIAMEAGLLRRDWRLQGQTLSYTDVTIAATALHHRLPLLTDNGKHFPMSDLQLFPLNPS
jgi:predicted nucleic acid-binding protein